MTYVFCPVLRSEILNLSEVLLKATIFAEDLTARGITTQLVLLVPEACVTIQRGLGLANRKRTLIYAYRFRILRIKLKEEGHE